MGNSKRQKVKLNGKKINTSLYISDELYNATIDFMEKTGWTFSELICELLTTYIEWKPNE